MPRCHEAIGAAAGRDGRVLMAFTYSGDKGRTEKINFDVTDHATELLCDLVEAITASTESNTMVDTPNTQSAAFEEGLTQ